MLSCLCIIQAQAQREGYVWAFGRNAGLDFNTGNPVALRTAVNQLEGMASVCNAYGELLFYTAGSNIYDRTHHPMPNGSANLLVFSGTQPAVIVQDPGNTDRYYVFTLEQTTYSGIGGILSYRVVDMTLNGGLGDVIGGTPILLDDHLTEKMTVVPGTGCNSIWVLVRSRVRNEYKSYHVTASGVNITPVISPAGLYNTYPNYNPYDVGTLVISPDLKKLAAAVGEDGNIPAASAGSIVNFRGIELYDFDRGAGTVSNPMQVDTGTTYYGLCFSPDNAKLYATSYLPSSATHALYQFDMTVPVRGAIEASRVHVYSGPSVTALKRGPDGKIYMNMFDGSYMATINFPNRSGTACQPRPYTVNLVPGTRCAMGLPNEIGIAVPEDTVRSARQVMICYRDSGTLTALNTGGRDYLWDDGIRVESRTVDSAGLYVVQYKKDCTLYADSFYVRFSRPVPVLTTRPPVCSGSNANLADIMPDTTDTLMFTYRWYTGDDRLLREQTTVFGDTLGEVRPGSYTVRISQEGFCDTSLPFSIDTPYYKASFTADTLACTGDTLHFTNTTPANSDTWRWQLGDGNTDTAYIVSHAYAQEGAYRVQLTAASVNGYCRDNAAHDVLIKTLHLSLQAGSPLADIGTQVMLRTAAPEPYKILAWMPEDMFADQQAYMQSVTVRGATRYLVIGRSSDGCPDTAFADVGINTAVSFPDAFTPNADGRNDIFRPVIAGPVPRILVFRVFDRWGKLVFDAGNAHGGWDGTYNGRPAAIGVYYYLFRAETAAGEQMDKKGEVTLLQ